MGEAVISESRNADNVHWHAGRVEERRYGCIAFGTVALDEKKIYLRIVAVLEVEVGRYRSRSRIGDW